MYGGEAGRARGRLTGAKKSREHAPGSSCFLLRYYGKLQNSYYFLTKSPNIIQNVV